MGRTYLGERARDRSAQPARPGPGKSPQGVRPPRPHRSRRGRRTRTSAVRHPAGDLDPLRRRPSGAQRVAHARDQDSVGLQHRHRRPPRAEAVRSGQLPRCRRRLLRGWCGQAGRGDLHPRPGASSGACPARTDGGRQLARRRRGGGPGHPDPAPPPDQRGQPRPRPRPAPRRRLMPSGGPEARLGTYRDAAGAALSRVGAWRVEERLMGRTALLATESHTSDAPVYRGHPLLGAAPDFRRDPFDTLLRAARLGPVVRFRVPPGVPIRSYGLFSPECAQRVLVQETAGYTKDSAPYQEVAAAFGNGLLTAQREEWHRQRRFVAPLFTPRRLEQDYVPTLVAEGTLLRDRWLTAPEATLDVHAASVRYTLRAVGRMLFGADLDPLLPAFGPAFAQLNVHLRQRLTASLLAPRSWPTPGNIRGRKAQRSLYGMVD